MTDQFEALERFAEALAGGDPELKEAIRLEAAKSVQNVQEQRRREAMRQQRQADGEIIQSFIEANGRVPSTIELFQMGFRLGKADQGSSE